MPASTPEPGLPLASEFESLRRSLGADLVDDLVFGAEAAGTQFLPGDEDLTFGFLQRVLTRLKREGRNRGLLFPKVDGEFRRYFDYMDADGAIWVVWPHAVGVDPAWFREQEVGDPERTYHELAPGAAPAIVAGFLRALADLKGRA